MQDREKEKEKTLKYHKVSGQIFLNIMNTKFLPFCCCQRMKLMPEVARHQLHHTISTRDLESKIQFLQNIVNTKIGEQEIMSCR